MAGFGINRIAEGYKGTEDCSPFKLCRNGPIKALV